MSILQRYGEEDELKLVDIDKDQSNKWRWDWLEKSIVVDPAKILPKSDWSKGSLTLLVKDYIRKVDIPGKASCTLCENNGYIKYGSTGVKAILDHLKAKKHVRNVVTEMENSRLPGVEEPRSDVTYGAPKAYFDAPPTTCVPPKTSVHIMDRVANFEAMLVGFIAENSLSFSMSERLIALTKEFAKDRVALKKLKMHRTTASYKLIHGLGKTVQDELTEKLRTTPFSMNMDESTSSNVKHVYTILVSYYDSVLKAIVVEHFGSIDVPSCTSKNLYNGTKKLVEIHQIPWKKLMAILCDSASTMRGTVSGLETKIRTTVAPHLLDIDGESCHHIHNIVKNFTSYFDQFLEHLFRDVSTEFKYSADSLDYLKEFSFHMKIDFRKPDNFIMARWLSVYDISLEFHHMLDAHKMLFSAYEKAAIQMKLKACEKELKKRSKAPEKMVNDDSGKKLKSKKELKKEKSSLLKQDAKRKKAEAGVLIKRKTSELSKTVLSDLKGKLVDKYKRSVTEKGRERKQRVIGKLHQLNHYTLLTSLYQSVLPLFKSYVMLFQSEKPLIHKVYYKQVDAMRTFFSYFVKPDVLATCKNGKQLLNLKLKEENLLPKELIFIGSTASKLVEKLGRQHVNVVSFLDKTAQAYIKCGVYIQKKLPLENKLLKAFSSIDPLFVTSPNGLVLKRLLSLPKLVLNILESEEEEQLFEQEVRALLVDLRLPPALNDDGKEVDCLDWWSSISLTYPTVFRMVTPVLSIFHGPRVESSFNVMGDVIDKKSGRMNMQTYSAIQGVKYCLQARQPLTDNRSVSMFGRKDRLYSPVHPKLAKNMRGAYTLHNAEQKKKRDEEEKRKQLFEVEKESTTRKMLKENNSADAEAAHLEHQRILQLAYNPKRKLRADDSSATQAKKKKQVQAEESSLDEAGVPSTLTTKGIRNDNDNEGEDDEVQVLTKKSILEKPKKKKQWTLDSFLAKH